MPACYGLWQQDDEGQLVLVERWDSREHLEKYTAWRTERGDIDKFGELLTAAPSIRYVEEFEAWESVGLLP